MQCMSTQSIRKENTVNKIRLYVFIYNVDTVNTTFREYTRFNGTYVDTVDTTFKEYTRFNGTYVDTVDTIKLECKS